MLKKILITTAIDYTNDVVHLGHSYQKIIADALARFYRLSGWQTYYVTGTDEHGGNIEQAAKDKGKTPKEFVDSIVAHDKKQWKALDLDYDRFIRTTDADHAGVVKDFWDRCMTKGDIYKGLFKGLYCFGCEAFKTQSEIADGKCSLHPTKQLQKIEEENYFFAWSKYQNFLQDLFDKHLQFVVPQSRFNEMQEFLQKGIADITISRSKKKVSWGIPVPGDPSQVIYVWFDGLINYYTAGIKTGFWDPDTKIIHILGKDNTRWHSLLWPAMLKSAGLRLPDQIYAHGFINLDGKKISKSLGNVIRPSDLVNQFGADAVRYFLLKYGPSVDDVDLSIEKLKKVYNSELANGLGNLISRVIALVNRNCDGKVPKIDQDPDSHPLRVDKEIHNWKKTYRDFDQYISDFRLDLILDSIQRFVSEADKYINETEPWKLAKNDEKQFYWVIYGLLDSIHKLAWQIYPFMPDTSLKIARELDIKKLLVDNPQYKDSLCNIKPGTKIKSGQSLFPRVS